MLFAWIAAVLLCAEANAGPIEVFHDGPLLADGKTDHVVYLSVPELLASDKVKITGSDLKVRSWAVRPGGLLTVSLRPTPAERPESRELNVRIKGEKTIEEALLLPVVPPAGQELVLVIEPPVLSAEQNEVLVTVQASGGAHLDPEARRIELASTLGELSSVSWVDGVGWQARLVLPDSAQAPERVLITATDWTAPEGLIGRAVLTVIRNKEVAVSGTPGAKATLTVAEDVVGPVVVGADGKGRFTLPMPPAGLEAKFTETPSGGEPETKTLFLEGDAAPELLFAPLPPTLRIPISRNRLFWVATSGPEDASPKCADLTMKGPGAPIAEAKRKGWCRIRLRPAALGPWLIQAKLGAVSTGQAVEVIEEPLRLSGALTPSVLETRTRDVVMQLKATDDAGGAVSGRQLFFASEGARVSGATKPVGRGGYEQRFRLQTGARQVSLNAYSQMPQSGLPPARLRLWSGIPGIEVPGDGPVPLVVVAEDAFGWPVRDVEVSFSVGLRGGGAPEAIRTGSSGLGFSWLEVGEEEGPVFVQATAGEMTAGAVVWQVLPGRQAPFLEALGNMNDEASLARWRALISTALVRREVKIEPLVQEMQPVPVVGVTVQAPGAVMQPVAQPMPIKEAKPKKVKKNAGASQAVVSAEKEPVGAGWALRGAVSDMGLHFSQSHDGAPDAVPTNASYGKPWPMGALGIEAGGAVWFYNFGLDADVRWLRYRVQIIEKILPNEILSAHAVGLYRFDVAGLGMVHAGLGYGKTKVISLFYVNNQKNVEVFGAVS